MPIAFFILGFIFDAIMLHRIDEPFVLFQQALYIILSAWIIGVELIEHTREIHVPRWIQPVWRYREGLLHFMLGTLLNSYTIFYSKSASAFTSFVFILILIGLLMLNEFKRFGKSQSQVHVAFLSLCVVSYLISLIPILLGFIGIFPFVLAIVMSILCFLGYMKWLKPHLSAHPKMRFTHLIFPFSAIKSTFIVFYFLQIIPPVPLSIHYMGIFHNIKKADGHYELSYTRPWWKFWQHGDQTFMARPGDAIICFAQIFSPSRFKDELKIRWLYKDPRMGWMPSDAIPLPIVGGREEGYRGYTKKMNYSPGEWRVQVETQDGREVGRIGFFVIADSSTEEREFKSILR
jgi:hypothetical protein